MFAIYIILGFVLVAAAVMVGLSHMKVFKMTSRTTGRIVRAEEREVRDEQERRDETVLTIHYAVHGRDYDVERILRGRLAARFPVGHVVEVRYYPADPTISDLVSAT